MGVPSISNMLQAGKEYVCNSKLGIMAMGAGATVGSTVGSYVCKTKYAQAAVAAVPIIASLLLQEHPIIRIVAVTAGVLAMASAGYAKDKEILRKDVTIGAKDVIIAAKDGRIAALQQPKPKASFFQNLFG